MAQIDTSSYPKFAQVQPLDLGKVAQQGLQIQGSMLSNQKAELALEEQQRNVARQRAIAPMISGAVKPDGTLDYTKLINSAAAHPLTAEIVPEFVEKAGRMGLLNAQTVNAQLAATQARQKLMGEFFSGILATSSSRQQNPDGSYKLVVNMDPATLRSRLTDPVAAAAGITPQMGMNFLANYTQAYSKDPTQAGDLILRAGLSALEASKVLDIALGKNTLVKSPGAITPVNESPLRGVTRSGPDIPVNERDPAREQQADMIFNSGVTKGPDGAVSYPGGMTETQWRQRSDAIAAGRVKDSRNPLTESVDVVDLGTGGLIGGGGPGPVAQGTPAPQTRPTPTGQPVPQNGLGVQAPSPQGPGVSEPNMVITPPPAPPGTRPSMANPPGQAIDLYNRGAEGTGIVPAAQDLVSRTLGQASSILPSPVVTAAESFVSRLPGGSDVVSGFNASTQNRQDLLNSSSALIRALTISSQNGVREQEHLRRTIGIEPGILDSPVAMRNRMVSVDRNLRTMLADENRVASDTGAPASQRREAVRKARLITDFLMRLNVPGEASRGGAQPSPQEIESEMRRRGLVPGAQ